MPVETGTTKDENPYFLIQSIRRALRFDDTARVTCAPPAGFVRVTPLVFDFPATSSFDSEQ